MKKFHFFVLLLFVTPLLYARTWHINAKDSYLELEIETEFTTPITEGEHPVLNGHFCLKKEKPKHCLLLTPEDLLKYDLKFYYPDIASEVTSDVSIVLKEDKHEISYEIPVTNGNESPQFIAQITNKGSKVAHYQKALAKLQALKTKLLQKQSHWPHKGKENINKLAETLKKIEARLTLRLQGESALIAKREFPLQIKNNISKPSTWSNAAEEWQVEFKAALGHSFEGEKTWLDIALIPYVTNSYIWKIEYRLNNTILKSFEVASPTAIIRDQFLSTPLLPGRQDLNIKIYKNEKEKSKNPKWETTFEKTYTFFTFDDATPPTFADVNPVPGRYVAQNNHGLSYIINDLTGRIDLSSIKAILKLENGEEQDFSNKLNYHPSPQALVPNIHGSQEGSTSYNVSGVFDNIIEGKHYLEVSGKDFAGNTSETISWELIYDRTPPSINQPLTPASQNVASIELPVTVSDATGVKFTAFVNNLPQYEVTASNGIFSESVPFQLSEGVNFITFMAIDEAGNSSTLNLPPIYVDTTPPILSDIFPNNGQVLTSLNFKVSGNSNELLSKIIIDGKETALNTKNFEISDSRPVEGEYTSEIIATDLYGNSSTFAIDFRIVLKLIRIELVSLEPKDGQILVKGLPGAARSGLEIDITGGFLNSEVATVEVDGSFAALLGYSSSYRLSATDPEINKSESYLVNYNADTTFTGIVKDVNDIAIPGVKVTIQSTGQYALTDGNGVFAIAKPATGDQKVIIDGTAVSEIYTQGLKKYSRLTLNVSLGNLQRNVFDRVIYLVPTLLDGSETEVIPDQEVLVTSVNAPGVTITIPAHTATFPAGVPQKINMMTIPSDKTSIDLLEFSKPTEVYALEPSGVTFSEPVKLTLPNLNEFPDGMELMIMSKNSETGYWEPDGVAEVVGDKIETKEGQGITHFSEVYATPYGLKLEEYAPSHRPGMYNEEGAVQIQIGLPTYKVFGKDLGVNLTYNSLWAKPSVFVTNSINTPTYHVKRNVSASGGGWGTKVKVDGYIETWQRPEYLKTQFISGDVSTPWLYFDVTNPPKQSTVSFSVDMSYQESGAYPANATYVLQYKYLTVQRIRVRKERTFGGTHTKYYNSEQSGLMDAIFPPPLQTNLYVQNKINSEYGSGWKLNLNEKILQPNSDKIVVEETNGKLSPYVLQTSVETLYHSDGNVNTISHGADGKLYLFKNKRDVGVVENGSYSPVGSLPYQPITIGLNRYYQTIRGDWAYYKCIFSKYKGDSAVIPTSAIVDGGRILTVDTDSRFVLSNNFSTTLAAGAKKSISLVDTKGEIGKLTDSYNFPNPNIRCNEYSATGCGSSLYYNVLYNYTHNDWQIASGCVVIGNGAYVQSGTVPSVGYAGGTITSSQFNQPKSIIQINADEFLVADRGNNLIRKINIAQNNVQNFAGTRQTFDNGDGGKAILASIYHPNALARDSYGNIYVASENGYIRKISPDGIIQRIAGKKISEGGVFKDQAPMSQMNFRNPQGLAIDSERGLLYVADTENHRVVQLDLETGNAKTVLGNNTCVANDIAEGKGALNISLCSPRDILVDVDGNLIYLDRTNKMIRKVNFGLSSTGVARFASVNINDTAIVTRLADGSFERKHRDGSVSKYTNDGHHVSSSDRFGNTQSFIYENGFLTGMTDPAGKTTSFFYNNGLLESIEDPTGRITRFNYNGNFLASVTFPDGTNKYYQYSEDGLLQNETDQKGAKTRYLYNQWNKLSEVILPDNSSQKVVDGLGKTYVSGNYSQETKAPVNEDREIVDVYKDAKGVETHLTKDKTGVVTSITDHKDRTTTIERDLNGRPTKIVKFDGTYTEFNYNQYGDLIYKYDSAADHAESFVYNHLGLLTKFTNALGATNEVFYDQLGRATQEKDFNGNSVFKSYLPNGLLNSATNAQGNTTSFEYDDVGNLIVLTSPQEEKTSFIRDAAGNLIEKVSAKGISTLYSFDLFNRLLSVTTGVTSSTPIGDTTAYQYTLTGQLSLISDPKGNKTIFEYDSMDRMVKKISPVGQVYSLAYDESSNVIKEVDPNGNVKIFVYDESNQLIKKILPDNTYEMIYDDYGNMTAISDNDSEINFSYNKIGSKYFVTSTIASGSILPTATLSYSYNKLGYLISMGSSFGTFTYSRDNEGRLTNLKNHIGENFGFSYDSANRLIAISRPQSVSGFAFDKNSTISSITHKTGNQLLNSYAYTRDFIGNKTSLVTQSGISNWGYDSNSQLVSSTNTELPTEYQNEVFNYDSLGNRLADQFGSSAYDEKSQRLVRDWKYDYFYDNNGNLIKKTEKVINGNFVNYDYSSENQLIKVTEYKNGILIKSSDYFYDALGRRTAKVVKDFEKLNEFSRKYLYNGQDILAELDESDNTLAIYTHSSLRMDDILSADIRSKKLATTEGSYFYLKDDLGSIVDITDASGAVVQHYSYSSFGRILAIKDGNGNDITGSPLITPNFTYTGREIDSETGLYYYRARYYDPGLGRFLTEDPHPGRRASPKTFNSKYIYAANNPINLIDPTGRFFKLPRITLSKQDQQTLIKVGILIAAGYTGGLAAGAFATGAWSGMVIGAIVGGAVGGIGYEAFGVGSFKEGFIGGAIAGGIAGYRVGSSLAGRNPSAYEANEELASETDITRDALESQTDCLEGRTCSLEELEGINIDDAGRNIYNDFDTQIGIDIDKVIPK
ncbi:MAG: hypothetical protein NDI69_06480 [Bacteriovoracaceae bacterium]|nr:hypothetical protein [Bacteriovoracaceae bacterium]